ncbi:unnamed protein product, partial [Phaeothamnion confervicola]
VTTATPHILSARRRTGFPYVCVPLVTDCGSRSVGVIGADSFDVVAGGRGGFGGPAVLELLRGAGAAVGAALAADARRKALLAVTAAAARAAMAAAAMDDENSDTDGGGCDDAGGFGDVLEAAMDGLTRCMLLCTRLEIWRADPKTGRIWVLSRGRRIRSADKLAVVDAAAAAGSAADAAVTAGANIGAAAAVLVLLVARMDTVELLPGTVRVPTMAGSVAVRLKIGSTVFELPQVAAMTATFADFAGDEHGLGVDASPTATAALRWPVGAAKHAFLIDSSTQWAELTVTPVGGGGSGGVGRPEKAAAAVSTAVSAAVLPAVAAAGTATFSLEMARRWRTELVRAEILAADGSPMGTATVHFSCIDPRIAAGGTKGVATAGGNTKSGSDEFGIRGDDDSRSDGGDAWSADQSLNGCGGNDGAGGGSGGSGGSTGGRLVLTLLGARGLQRADRFGLSDPYCAVRWCGADFGRTATVQKSLDPDWHTITAALSPAVTVAVPAAAVMATTRAANRMSICGIGLGGGGGGGGGAAARSAQDGRFELPLPDDLRAMRLDLQVFDEDFGRKGSFLGQASLGAEELFNAAVASADAIGGMGGIGNGGGNGGNMSRKLKPREGAVGSKDKLAGGTLLYRIEFSAPQQAERASPPPGKPLELSTTGARKTPPDEDRGAVSGGIDAVGGASGEQASIETGGRRGNSNFRDKNCQTTRAAQTTVAAMASANAAAESGGCDDLEIWVLSARGLRRADFFRSSDPYCVLRVAGVPIGRTRTVRNTIDPVWTTPEERFIIPVDGGGEGGAGKKSSIEQDGGSGSAGNGGGRAHNDGAAGGGSAPNDDGEAETAETPSAVLEVWDADIFGADFLGEATLPPLSTLQRPPAEPLWLELRERSNDNSGDGGDVGIGASDGAGGTSGPHRGSDSKRSVTGAVQIRLRRLPRRAGSITAAAAGNEGGQHDNGLVATVRIHGARGLRRADRFGLSDPRCIIKLNGDEIGATSTVYRSLAPSWDPRRASFKVSLPEDRAAAAVTVEVWDMDLGRRGDMLGVADVGTALLLHPPPLPATANATAAATGSDAVAGTCSAFSEAA